MARLGRGQPFGPKVSQPPPAPPANGNVNGNVAQVTVTAHFGAVNVTTAQPAVPGVTIAPLYGTPGTSVTEGPATVAVAGYTTVPEGTVTMSPAAVTVAAHFGTPGTSATQAPPGVTVAPHYGAANVNTTESPAAVAVAGSYGYVFVEPPVPEKMPFVPGHARVGQAVPGEPGNIPNNSANVSIAQAQVTVAAHFGAVSVSTTESSPAAVTVAGLLGGAGAGASEGPGLVNVAAYYGLAVAGVVVNQPSVPNVTVTAYFGAVNVSTTESPGTVAVAGQFQAPTTNVNAVAPPGVSVVPPGPQLSANPYGAGGSTTGWIGFNGTLTATTSPPAGCPFSSAFQYVNNGVTSGAIEGTSGNSWAALPSQQYTMSAWVYTSFGSVQIGFDWRDASHNYLSTSSTSIGVPVNTWTFVTFTATSNASSAFAYARVGASSSSGETVYATQIFAWQPDLPGTETITLPGPVAAVTVAPEYGTPGVILSLGPATVNAQAYFGQVQVTTPQPSVPNVSIQALYGSAGTTVNTNFNGPVGNVNVAGQLGGPGVTLPGPTVGITVQAHYGAVSVSVSLTGSVAVAAPVGTPGTSATFGPGHVTAAAPVGTPGTSVTVPTPAIGVAAPTGTVNVTVVLGPGVVNVAAPTGGAGGGASLPPPNVEVTSPAGTASVATSLPPAACGVHAPRGIPVTSVNGATAGIVVLAPVSPLVAGLYPGSSTAIMSFYAGAVKQRKVWFGYGAVNTMNTNVDNPGET